MIDITRYNDISAAFCKRAGAAAGEETITYATQPTTRFPPADRRSTRFFSTSPTTTTTMPGRIDRFIARAKVSVAAAATTTSRRRSIDRGDTHRPADRPRTTNRRRHAGIRARNNETVRVAAIHLPYPSVI